MPSLTFSQWSILVISAILGITVGDTAYFFSLQDLGSRKALLLQTVNPLFGALFAFIFLKEILSVWALSGIPLTLIGVMWVISESTPAQESKNLSRGCVWGLFSCASQALGAMLLKWVLNTSNLSSLESSTIRLLIGTFCLGFWLFASPQAVNFPRLQFSQWRQLGFASFLGTFLGLWFDTLRPSLRSHGGDSYFTDSTCSNRIAPKRVEAVSP